MFNYITFILLVSYTFIVRKNFCENQNYTKCFLELIEKKDTVKYEDTD